ncbi:hypothetical protein Ddye_022126 [Dipteronia dyeriana]|uniref:Uncharacterized protein n=1 Tax=Dipteronia dyeriana TaxID=168575 RepID=A0AAD9U2Z2_9ROSI|nr:hypothetical protein Ddye_022126 [Dipteronia dyeriana]
MDGQLGPKEADGKVWKAGFDSSFQDGSLGLLPVIDCATNVRLGEFGIRNIHAELLQHALKQYYFGL